MQRTQGDFYSKRTTTKMTQLEIQPQTNSPFALKKHGGRSQLLGVVGVQRVIEDHRPSLKASIDKLPLSCGKPVSRKLVSSVAMAP